MKTKQRIKLSSALFDTFDCLDSDARNLQFVADSQSSATYDKRGGLVVSGLVDFATYLGGVSVKKWRDYADLDAIWLHIEIKGDACELIVRALDEKEDGSHVFDVRDIIALQPSGKSSAFDIALPLDCTIAGFALLSEGKTTIQQAYYFTEVPASRLHEVRLALCTTTYHKEEFVTTNIKRIRDGILESKEPISGAFHMFVVDNGKTLKASDFAHSGISIIPNENVGGSGGFARGMMAALDDKGGFTHVILMDDDVRVLPESFHRLFALLQLVKPEYAKACVNGAMFMLEHPSMQFEDVSYMRRIGGYQSIKPRLDMLQPRSVVSNERISVEVDKAYGAWWFSCIPLELVREKGLPLPFFIRCDDVEYGLRLGARYMTMNGICVWHAQFAGRFNAAVVCYQYARNLAATLALHTCYSDAIYMLQFWRTFHIYLRSMDYASAELWLDGLEDYLKGPHYVASLNGAQTMQEKSAKAEKLEPLDPEMLEKLNIDLSWLEGDPAQRSRLYKLAVTLPHDRHWFPDWMLNDVPGVLAPGAGDDFTPWYKTAMRKRLVALSLDAQRGAIRSIDRKRHKELSRRYRDLFAAWTHHKDKIAQLWRDALPELTSYEFWRAYLKRAEND